MRNRISRILRAQKNKKPVIPAKSPGLPPLGTFGTADPAPEGYDALRAYAVLDSDINDLQLYDLNIVTHFLVRTKRSHIDVARGYATWLLGLRDGVVKTEGRCYINLAKMKLGEKMRKVRYGK